MRVPNGHRRKTRRKDVPTTPDELEAELLRYAVKLFDMGDGRAVDWAMIAATAFKVGFRALNEVPGDPRAERVLRKVEGGIYNRLAGNPDDGTPFPPGRPERPNATPEPAMRPDPGLHR